MTFKIKLAVKCLLILSLLSNASTAYSQSYSLELGQSELLPTNEAVEQISKKRARDSMQAPSWVKKLQQKHVISYFPRNWPTNKPIPTKNGEELFKDTVKLHTYFEQENPANQNQFHGFIQGHLRPFIKTLTLNKMKESVVSRWTVEQLVVIKQLTFLSRFPNFFKRSMELVTGPHLKGASVKGVKIAIAAGIFYGLYTLGAGEAFKHGFYNGVMGALVAAALSWFIGPTSEAIKKHAARLFARPEIWVGRGADYITNWFFGPAEKDVKENTPKVDGPKIATIENDGMDFTMNPRDQKTNWEKCMTMWVEVAKTFGQLLRDTLHHGRVLMTMQWTDERDASLNVVTIRNGLMLIDLKIDTLLTPYFSVALLQGGREQLDNLKTVGEEYKILYSRLMDSAEMTETEMNEIKSRLLNVRSKMYELGISKFDLEAFDELQLERARLIGKLITVLTTNEMRAYFMAEANRNLAETARIAQRAVRRGYGNQEFVDLYRNHIQAMQRQMGFDNTASDNFETREITDPIVRRIKTVKQLSCSKLF